MKKVIIHSVPVIISFIWMVAECHTLNPISLKGPDFLKFYLLLLLGFYASVFILRSFKETFSKTTFSCMILLFVLGSIKLIRGLVIGKPVGFLIMILLLECVGSVLLIQYHLKNKMK